MRVDITTKGAGRVKDGGGRRGLEGVIATTSAVSSIIGGKLTYRGYDIDDLAEHSTFEETVYLLWTGELPTEAELRSFREEISAAESLPPEVIELLQRLPDAAAPMEWLRTAVSALGLYDGHGQDTDAGGTWRAAVRILARFPVLVAAIHRLRHGQDLIDSDPGLPLAAVFLTMVTGVRPSDEASRILDEVLILHADHELNASTFAARVAASTRTDLYSAVVAALCTLKGPLHGGAAEGVYRMLSEIDQDTGVRSWLDGALERRERIMGFGHRVYKSGDPRAQRLKRLSERLAGTAGDRRWYDVSVRLEAEVAQDRGLLPNVDFYSASVYTYLGIPPELFTPIFAMSRVAGWIAHIMEQYEDNRLIRPRAEYVGHTYRTYPGMENR
jgi:citrate synthase